jgi:dTDP-4-dehydrorhamnose reductase
MSNIVVFGASGQLGQCLKSVALKDRIANIYFLSSSEADISSPEALKKAFETYKPQYVINCAAYTAVDKAEDEQEAALKINKTGVVNLSHACAEHHSILIHISTDFVFKGDKAKPLTEQDETKPISIYGQTKLDGEKAIESILNKFYIIRTGWLYSVYGNNFAKTMLRLGAEKEELKIIADQVGTPTYAIDLASTILQIISSGSTAYGIYHFSNEGVTSWYDFAKAIFDLSGSKVKAIPVKTEEYFTKATRPAYSVLDKSKIKKEFNLEIPYWRDSLITCINKLKQ